MQIGTKWCQSFSAQSHLDKFIEVGCVLVIKGEKAIEQGIQENSQAPHICLGATVLEALDQLWRGEGRGRGRGRGRGGEGREREEWRRAGRRGEGRGCE